MKAFSQFSPVSFSFVDDSGDLHENVDMADVPTLEYGCGLFELTKRAEK
jgi:hypothetical protein